MKKILVILACLFFMVNSLLAAEDKFLNTKNDTKKICDRFMQKIVAGKIEAAFAIIEPYFPIPESELSMIIIQTVKQLGMSEQRFGNPIGYEFIKEDEVKETLIKYTYLEKFDKHAVRWIFVFYKPEEKWLVNHFVWDDNIQALFD